MHVIRATGEHQTAAHFTSHSYGALARHAIPSAPIFFQNIDLSHSVLSPAVCVINALADFRPFERECRDRQPTRRTIIRQIRGRSFELVHSGRELRSAASRKADPGEGS